MSSVLARKQGAAASIRNIYMANRFGNIVVKDGLGIYPDCLENYVVEVARFETREEAVEYMVGDQWAPGYIFNDKGEPECFVAPLPKN